MLKKIFVDSADERMLSVRVASDEDQGLSLSTLAEELMRQRKR